MALKTDSFSKNVGGVKMPILDVEIKVKSVTGSKFNAVARVYWSKEGKDLQYKHYTFTPLPNNFNWLEQSYVYLKSLEEFKDCINI